MIYQIDIQGKSVLGTFKTLSEVNKSFGKVMQPNISKLLKRDGSRYNVDGFLWANANTVQEALESVQDLALQGLFNTTKVSEKGWNRDTIDELITKIKK